MFMDIVQRSLRLKMFMDIATRGKEAWQISSARRDNMTLRAVDYEKRLRN